MDYKLIEKLKDSGYKFKKPTEFEGIIIDGETCLYPTLSELIDACGREFGRLEADYGYENNIVYWLANKEDNLSFYGSGKTPEEAVANLWLELNKND